MTRNVRLRACLGSSSAAAPVCSVDFVGPHRPRTGHQLTVRFSSAGGVATNSGDGDSN